MNQFNPLFEPYFNKAIKEIIQSGEVTITPRIERLCLLMFHITKYIVFYKMKNVKTDGDKVLTKS
ncbi:MAG: hypothetical protein S4CHLAM123_14450 [Chlamydiales bacterium]|nr:hypothetical protein [Chlamydiales bacterium]